MAQYQGHKNWNHWNVSLWINNSQNLYNLAKECIDNNKGNRENAAREMLDILSYTEFPYCKEKPFTPDGAPYSVSSIRAAMVGM